MKTKSFLKNLVCIIGLAGLGVVTGACQATATPIPSPTVLVDTPVPPSPTPVPTKSLIQDPIIQQPIIAPTVAITYSGTTIAGSSTVSATVPKSLGQSQEAGGLAIVPSSAAWQNQLGSDKANSGDTFLLITISVQNMNENEEANFDPAQFALTDAAGRSYPLTGLASASNTLKATHLDPGEKTEGIVIYEVPQGHEQDTWTLQYKSPGAPLLWAVIK